MIPQVIELPRDEDVESVAAGFQHALILTTLGRLLGLGSNNKRQLGVSASIGSEQSKPFSIGATWNSSFVLDESRRTFFACGSNNHGQLGGVLEGQLSAIVSLLEGFVVDSWVCGSEHVLVLTRSVCISHGNTVCNSLVPSGLLIHIYLTEILPSINSSSVGDGTNMETWDSDILKT
jgi:alpha-tubulin suppressor-like RCC1 family protein